MCGSGNIVIRENKITNNPLRLIMCKHTKVVGQNKALAYAAVLHSILSLYLLTPLILHRSYIYFIYTFTRSDTNRNSAMKLSFFSILAVLHTSIAQTVRYAGVNIAGLDFSCDTSGTCNVAGATSPGQAGIDQIKHFIVDSGMNAFRLPVSWQYLLNNNLGGTLDSTRFRVFDNLVQGCIGYGAAMCLIDLHNYARWNGGIIGQGGPTDAQFASLWSQLATKYKNNPSVAFGVMNEPVRSRPTFPKSSH
jgi:aryl-phospho-beta-D-glucosidase BglC (GH1 family)